MLTSDFDYDLPPELIAQEPLPERDASRMLVVDRETGALEHCGIRDILDYLCPGDLMVVNDTRVFPARIFGQRKDTGGKAEILLVEEIDGDASPADGPRYGSVWRALLKSGFPPRAGQQLVLASGRIEAEILERGSGGGVTVALTSREPLMNVLELEGKAPLPPYIKREATEKSSADRDRARYQTVYADSVGAVAAPTAGLHFTPQLLDALKQLGVKRAAVTLHVGPGTFRPVKAERVEEHVMDEERYVVPAATADAVASARREGRRVVAVGSTTVRTLETVAAGAEGICACSGRSSLFITPPYQFKAVDAMLTNFHLPRSTLLMMVSAFAAPGDAARGRALILRAYKEAVERAYRFFSYGDCMLLI